MARKRLIFIPAAEIGVYWIVKERFASIGLGPFGRSESFSNRIVREAATIRCRGRLWFLLELATNLQCIPMSRGSRLGDSEATSVKRFARSIISQRLSARLSLS
jgi:hypothetical protein